MNPSFNATVTTLIKAPVETVWDALTNPAMLKQYFYGTTLVTDWKVGSPISFRGEWDGKPYEDKGFVLNYEPNKTLTYSYWSSWSGLPDQPEYYLPVTYSLRDLGNGETEVTVMQGMADKENVQHTEQNWRNVLEGMGKLVEQ